MSNVISIENRTSNGVRSFTGLIIFEGKFEGFLHFPADYNNKNMFDLMLDRAEVYDAEILFDENGLGRVLEDYLIQSPKRPYVTLNLSDIKLIPKVLERAQVSLFELAIDSQFDMESKIEFLKLENELYNLKIKQSGIDWKLSRVDESIGCSRARCYLQYYYKYVFNKSL